MRVTDRSLQDSYLISMKIAKERLIDVQQKVASQKKVLKPSDSPLANSKIMRFSNEIDSLAKYQSNIADGKSILENSISAMTGIQKEMQSLQVELTSLNNATATPVLNTYADKIDQSLKIILDYANYDFKGNYLFSGTDQNGKPFGFNGAETAVEMKLNDIGGIQKINISNTAQEQINVSGEQLFMPVIKQLGNIDSTQAIGSTQPLPATSTKIYNADGAEFTLYTQYTKTAANTYNMTYRIEDSGSNVIAASTVNDFVFDASTGELQTIDGNKANGIHIKNASNKIDFIFDTTNLKEKATTASLSYERNQDVDIFNTLISIRDNLRNGIRPNDKQIEIVNSFSSHVTNMLSNAGNKLNRLTDTSELLENQDLELKNLLSNEQDVDMAKMVLELQTQQYNLDVFYKMSSMILPKSLLDFL